MAGFKKIIIRTSIFLLFIPLLLTGGLLFIGHYYGDGIKQKLLGELSGNLSIEISVSEIDLNLFEKFPYASLEFSTVDSKEKEGSEGKSLLKAEKVFLLFNLTDILYKKVKIHRIELEGAFLNLITRENGETNYRVYQGAEKGPQHHVDLQLKKILLKNVTVFYHDKVSNHEYFFRVNQGEIEMKPLNKAVQIMTHGNVYSFHLKLGDHLYLNEQEIDLNINLITDKNFQQAEIKKGILKSQGLSFELAGKLGLTKNGQHIDIELTAQKAPVVSFKNLIPPEYLKPVKDYSLDGLLGFTARIKGGLSGKKVPHLYIEFLLEKGDFYYKEKDITIKKLAFTGHFDNGPLRNESSYVFVLDSISASHKAGDLRGKLFIKNFSKPEIQVSFNSQLDLNELHKLIAFDQLEQVSGNLKIDIEFKKQLLNFRKFTTQDFVSSQTSGNLLISDAGFIVKGNYQKFAGFNGNFQFNNKDLLIKKFSGNISGNDFAMDGLFKNVLAYLFLPNETVTINANYVSKKMDINKIFENTVENSGDKTLLTFSDQVNFDLDVKIDTFLLRKFKATNITGRIQQKNKLLRFTNARLNSMEGHVDLSGTINGSREDEYKIYCSGVFDQVNIRGLFYEFGDFGQDNLTYNHLLGKVNARVDYQSNLSPSLYVDPASVICFADIEINNGELIGYEPLYKLSKYIKEDGLKHIKFSQLKNKIKIQDEIIYFPEMDILSNTLNITLYGNHSFRNEVDYHIQLLVSDIIARKEKIKQDMGGNFEQEDKAGKTKLFLQMTGNANDPEIRYDTKEVRKKIATDLAAEKKELKKIMAEEFKWLSGNKNKGQIKDTLIEGNNSQKNFIVEWGQADSILPEGIPGKKKNKPKPGSKEKDFIISWDEENDTIK